MVRRRAALVRSDAVVALGATAAQALLGGSVKIMRDRGRPIDVAAAFMILVTVYPAYLLRIRAVAGSYSEQGWTRFDAARNPCSRGN